MTNCLLFAEVLAALCHPNVYSCRVAETLGLIYNSLSVLCAVSSFFFFFVFCKTMNRLIPFTRFVAVNSDESVANFSIILINDLNN